MANGGLLRFAGWLRVLKNDAVTLYYAWKHPHTPALVKGLLVALITYVISPIDIIPDYLPFLGIVDDAALVPAAILFLNRLLPNQVRQECQRESDKWRGRIPLFIGIAFALIIAWSVLMVVVLYYILS